MTALPQVLKSIVVILSLWALHARAAEPVQPISGQPLATLSAAGNSFAPAFSADGQSVVFVSHANNLVTNDDFSLSLDVFVRNLATGEIKLASVNMSGVGGANADANDPSISANGQFVAFASRASNLVNNDTNGASDVFVRDLAAGTTRLVSVDVTGTQGALGPAQNAKYPLSSSTPLISADGRWVAFQSSASNLVACLDANRAPDVFLRDLQSNVTHLLSLNTNGTGSASDKSELWAMTPDGQFVAFSSAANNLVANPDGQSEELYVRDVAHGATLWASTNVSSFLVPPVRCYQASLSQDGRYVVFKAEPKAGGSRIVCRHDLLAGSTIVVCSNTTDSAGPSLSADGRWVAFESNAQIYVWDAQTGSNTLVTVTVDGAGPASGAASTPVLSLDGTKVAFLFAANEASGSAGLTTNALNSFTQLYVRDLVRQTTTLVSVRANGVPSIDRNLGCILPALDQNGARVAFESADDNLVPEDKNRACDVLLRHLESESTELLSTRHPERPANTGTSLSTAWPNSLSADSRLVAFTTVDNNLTSDDTNMVPDVFLRELATGSLARVGTSETNLAYGPFFSANSHYLSFVGQPRVSYPVSPSAYRLDLLTGSNALVGKLMELYATTSYRYPPAPISSDGRLVVFQSRIVPADFYGPYNLDQVFVRDMDTGELFLASRVLYSKVSAGSGESIKPVLSPDDRWVVFQSRATDLTTNTLGLSSACYRLFAVEPRTNQVRLLSFDENRLPLNDNMNGAVFSANARYVAFYAVTNRMIYRHDFVANANLLVCTNCLHPSLSADGSLVAYEAPRAGTNITDVYVKDLQTGEVQLVSLQAGGSVGGNGSSTSPQISRDGRFVVFTSQASDLVENDTNKETDIFVRDRVLGTTLLLTRNCAGTASGNGHSSNPFLAADGRTIIFHSFATDLIPGDYNDTRDVFVVRLSAGDGDHDGLADDWELAYFGNLSRDGAGDFDGDGLTDLQEYQAGTDPTNRGSVLRAFVITPVGGGMANVIWNAVPAKTYRVQFKDNVNDPEWRELPGTVTAVGPSASLLDVSAPPSQRFYRVVVVP